jgi:hypothetical protein
MITIEALRLTADKREIKDFPKLPSATSFIRKPLIALGLKVAKGCGTELGGIQVQ